MTPEHFAAYILDPKYKGEGLSEEEDTMGMEFIDAIKPLAMKDVLTYRAMTFPFKDFMFKYDLLKKTHAIVWWKSLGSKGKLSQELLGWLSHVTNELMNLWD
ncbi:hypothetical protein EVAR_10672_1 [Eumeta japonica]|uniref:Uncharacterized protein n=1 Tax=Eumeta variegata TaxID=151549 RepID=A0A4C1U709_EUMVA|nr:hypothetical protein EVAR_10672_1 [Eumeta japonica]